MLTTGFYGFLFYIVGIHQTQQTHIIDIERYKIPHLIIPVGIFNIQHQHIRTAAYNFQGGRDAMADSQSYLHGKTYAIYGDPDFVYAMARFILETGGEPRHCLATNGSKSWAKKMQALFDSSPFGKDCQVWPGKDLWHMRSIMATEPVTGLLVS